MENKSFAIKFILVVILNFLLVLQKNQLEGPLLLMEKANLELC